MVKQQNVVGDGVRNTKHINIYSKGYTNNWSKEIFLIWLCAES